MLLLTVLAFQMLMIRTTAKETPLLILLMQLVALGSVQAVGCLVLAHLAQQQQ